MPGTGKTATTLEVIKKLNPKGNRLFEFIHINAMALTNPNLVYSVLYEKITGRRVNPTSSATFLDEFFKKKDKLSILRSRIQDSVKLREEATKLRVVLIDELDALVTKK